MQSLPKTSYYKLIDAWLMFTLLIQVGIFGLHTVVGTIINRGEEEEEKKAKEERSREAGTAWQETKNKDKSKGNYIAKAKRVSSLGKIVIVVVVVVFNAAFWFAALREYYSG